MAGETAAATGDTSTGATPTPSNGVKWPTASDLASWNETPSETDGNETPAEEPAVVEEEVEDVPVEETAPEVPPVRAPVPYARLEQTVRQKQEALQQLAQATAENKLLQAQLQQVIDYVQQNQGKAPQAPEPVADEFVDPDRAELDALKAQLKEVNEWRHTQAVAAQATAFEQEYQASTGLYPLATKAPQLVFALLQNNKTLSVSDAVKEVHNHLAGVIPKPAPVKPVAPPVARNPAVKPPPPKGPTSNVAALSTQPRYKTLEEAQKAYLSQL